MSALVSTAQGAPKAGEVEDGELVRRVRRGDEQAFEALYHRYHRRITAYIHGMVHDHARAEDVAQDVFVSALRRMRETDRPIAFKPWIYEIAKNACIDQFRRSRRAEEISYDAEEGMGAADYGRLVSSDAMPETQLESKQNLDHLRGAFGGLSETHHEILVMRELEGLSYREIGERLDMSRPSVESTLFRARRRLTEEYEELVSGARCQRIQGIISGSAAAVPGARDQRRLARHVSHCQPCRRQARLAGLDIPVTPDRPVRQRIAAVLPLPFFLRKRWLGDAATDPSAASSSLSGVAHWSAQFGASVDPGWFKAAATAVTVAVAGAGAGLAGNAATPTSPVGSLGQIVAGIQSADDDHGASASSRIASGNSAPTAGGATNRAATAAASTAATPSSGAAGGAGTTAAAGTPSAADAELPATGDPVDDVSAAVSDTGADVPAGTGGGGSGSDAQAPNANVPGTPDVEAPPAPEVSVPANAPTPPPVEASAPDPAATADETAEKAEDAIKGGLVGG